MPSTAIRAISYDEVSRTMFVTFVDGDLYAYFEVPAALYRAFRGATSKGGFFARRVRNRFRYERVDLGPGDLAGAPATGPPGGPASPPPAAAGR